MAQNGMTKTYVEGFDEVLGGGIPGNRVVLIKGSTGTMKSSLAYYILIKNAELGKKSLYMTLEQDRASLEQQMLSLGLVGSKYQNELFVFDLSKGREGIEEIGEKIKKLGDEGNDKLASKGRKDVISSILQTKIRDLKEKLGFELIALDSLDALRMILHPERPRATVFHLFEFLRRLGLTCFVISESSLHGNNMGQDHALYEDFLADGIIELKMEMIGNSNIQRRIRCIKMRGIKHSTDYHSFFCGKNSFEISKAIIHRGNVWI
jgi:circadian clock protein KaiC